MILALVIVCCSEPNGDLLNLVTDNLAECPERPNCVYTKAQDTKHVIKPFHLNGDPIVSWDAIRTIIGNMPRNKIITTTDRYLHVECKSRLFGFIDDLELQLNPANGKIEIRSASRIGFSDLGVNRRRVENLRQKLTEKGLIKQDLDTSKPKD